VRNIFQRTSVIRVYNLTPDLLNTKHGVMSAAMFVSNTTVVLVLKSKHLATPYDRSSDPVMTVTDFFYFTCGCVFCSRMSAALHFHTCQ